MERKAADRFDLVPGTVRRVKRALARLVVGALLSTAFIPLPVAFGQTASPTTTPTVGFDGDPATTERLNEAHPTFAAVDISRLRFGTAGAGGRQAAHVVVSRDDTFADSVAGSGLAGEGPLLFTATAQLPTVTESEITRVLAPGGRVYLLGGTAAISAAVEDRLRSLGFAPQRLDGATRVETGVAVADVVRSKYFGVDVLLARAYGPTGNDTAAWADSIAGGALAAARRVPILVTQTGALDGPVAEWLARDRPAGTTLLGGEAALSVAVAARVPNPRRVSGAERTATAAAVATQLWGASTTGVRKFVVSNGASPSGWAFGFAAAGVASDALAPVLLVTTEVTDATVGLTRTCGAPQVDLLVVGDGTVVPAPLREQLDAADRYACGPGGSLVYPSDLGSFPECAEVLAYFRTSALERVGPYGLGGYGDYHLAGGPMPGAPMPGAERTLGAPAPTAGAPAGDGSFSTTNVQEEGVDEPDIVKSDGRHLFSVAANTLRIVRIDDGAPRLVSNLTLPSEGSHELLLSGTRLLVATRKFGSVSGGGGFDGGGVRPASTIAPHRVPSITTLTSIDFTDPSRPMFLGSIDIDGDYRSARMIGSVARVVIQSDPDPLPFVFPTTTGADAEREAAEQNRQLIRSSTLDTWLPGYVLKRANGEVAEQGPLLPCGAVRPPPLFSGLGTLSVVTIDVTGASVKPTSSAAVVASGQTVYASTSRLFVSTGRWGWEPDALDSGVTTEVHGFDIADPAATRYVASGAVPGYILNQFSLSEHGGHLRVATTTQPPWRNPGTPVLSDNGVHVLAEQGGKLVEIGKVRGLGKGERIYAVRFFGDVAAVVTFRQIDPLYLLDLSQPAAPRVTGELKIPGYSAYLHRVSPNQLVGVGRDATTDGRVTGAQVSLFDITDRGAPRLVRAVRYANGFSVVEHDHHAFLHWPATGLVVVPMSQSGPTSGTEFTGAVGLTVAPTNIAEIGRATHMDEAATAQSRQITRSLVAGGALLTVSDAGVEAGDLATLAERSFLGLGS